MEHIDEITGEITGFPAKSAPFFRSAYNYDTDIVSRETGLACTEEEGMTQQQFRDECDINTIVERFGITGQLPDNPRMPVSGDFTGLSDFHSAMNAVRNAQEAFEEFPADIRAQFHNDPQKMMAFLENDKNREKALEMGLLPKPPEKTRDMVDAVDELKAHFVSQTGATKEK